MNHFFGVGPKNFLDTNFNDKFWLLGYTILGVGEPFIVDHAFSNKPKNNFNVQRYTIALVPGGYQKEAYWSPELREIEFK